MKLQGKKLSEPRMEVIVFPRQGDDLVFKARCILDHEPFEKLCPQPQPLQRILPGGKTSLNIESPEFEKAWGDWSEKKLHWIILKSLEATEELEWETVNMEDPDTYSNFLKELKESFSPTEITMLRMLVNDARGLNHIKIEEATQSFLAGRGKEREDESSPKYRSAKYAEWRACERFSIRPEGVKSTWNACDVWAKAQLIAYDQIRGYEEQERDNTFYRMLGAHG